MNILSVQCSRIEFGECAVNFLVVGYDWHVINVKFSTISNHYYSGGFLQNTNDIKLLQNRGRLYLRHHLGLFILNTYAL